MNHIFFPACSELDRVSPEEWRPEQQPLLAHHWWNQAGAPTACQGTLLPLCRTFLRDRLREHRCGGTGWLQCSPQWACFQIEHWSGRDLEYRSCDITIFFWNFPTLFFIFRKSIKNNVQMSKNQLNMLSIGWDTTIWINRFPTGTHCYIALDRNVMNQSNVTLSSNRKSIYLLIW